MKKLIALLLALLMASSLIVCIAEEKEPVTLSMWFLANEATDALKQDWVKVVNEEYPWITVEPELLTSDAIAEKLSVAYATGTTPDIIFEGYSKLAPAVQAGLTVDLTDVVNGNRSRMYSDVRDGVVNGEYHYIPLELDAAYCYVVNMTLAERLGVANMLPEDKETWSYDEFLDFLRAAKAADPSIIPTCLYAGSRSGDAWYYSCFLGNGVEITNEDLTATAFNVGENREAALEVLNFFKTLIDEQLVPSGSATLIDADINEMYKTGNVLILPGGFNMVPQMKSFIADGTCADFESSCVAIPTADGEKAPYAVTWGSAGIVGFGNNGHEEEVRLAIGALTGSGAAGIWKEIETAAGNASAFNDAAVEYEDALVNEVMQHASDYTARCARSDFGILEPWYSSFRDTFYVQLQDFFTGNIDAGTLLDNWQASADDVISTALASN